MGVRGVKSRPSKVVEFVEGGPAPVNMLSLLPSDKSIDIRVYYDQTFAEVCLLGGCSCNCRRCAVCGVRCAVCGVRCAVCGTVHFRIHWRGCILTSLLALRQAY